VKVGADPLAVVPTPLSATSSGLPLKEPPTETLPTTVDGKAALVSADGAKLTLMVQLAPAARLAGQLLVCVKSPLTTTPATLAAEAPVLTTVTDRAALWVSAG
jgi:hypothetical protein